MVCLCVVLSSVLSHTVVSMQERIFFPQTMVVKEVIRPADDCVCPIPYPARFVCEEVNLARYGLTVHSKDGTLSWGEIIDGALAALGPKGSVPMMQKGTFKNFCLATTSICIVGQTCCA